MPVTRRAALAAPFALAAGAAAARPAPPKAGFRFCLNTSTIRLPDGKPRPIVDAITAAQKAGFAAIEPWVSEVEAYVKAGNTAADLGKRFADAGLAVPDAIGFAEWIVDDPARRKKGLEQAKRDMDLMRQVGCKQIAAPPVGATGRNPDEKTIDPQAAADRYRDLLALGQSLGVTPLVEVWGFSKTLKRLGETWLVAAECGRSGGAVLPDVYHLYKGGSDFAGLKLLSAAAVGIFHVNDYPRIDRAKIQDADRVYPGDGIAPLGEVFATLKTIGYAGFVSLELFNRGYWKLDPHLVAKTGFDKLTAVAGA